MFKSVKDAGIGMLMKQFGLPPELQNIVNALMSKNENEQRSAMHSIVNDMLIARLFDFFKQKVAEKNPDAFIHITLTQHNEDVFVNAITIDAESKVSVLESYKLKELITEIPMKKTDDDQAVKQIGTGTEKA